MHILIYSLLSSSSTADSCIADAKSFYTPKFRQHTNPPTDDYVKYTLNLIPHRSFPRQKLAPYSPKKSPKSSWYVSPLERLFLSCLTGRRTPKMEVSNVLVGKTPIRRMGYVLFWSSRKSSKRVRVGWKKPRWKLTFSRRNFPLFLFFPKWMMKLNQTPFFCHHPPTFLLVSHLLLEKQEQQRKRVMWESGQSSFRGYSVKYLRFCDTILINSDKPSHSYFLLFLAKCCFSTHHQLHVTLEHMLS